MFQSTGIHEVHIRLNKYRGGETSNDTEGNFLFRQNGDYIAMFNSVINTNNLFYFNAISNQRAKYNTGCTDESGSSSAAIKSTVAHELPATWTMYFTNCIQHDKCLNGTDLSKTLKPIRILGFMTLISYMVVILFTWMNANLDGYVYFSAGEPMLSIKYLEWILGFTGIFVATDCLFKEIRIT